MKPKCKECGKQALTSGACRKNCEHWKEYEAYKEQLYKEREKRSHTNACIYARCMKGHDIWMKGRQKKLTHAPS